MHNTLNTHKPVLAFDIHKVLLYPTIWGMIKVLAKNGLASLIVLLDPRFWYHILYNGAIPERTVEALVRTYAFFGISKKLFREVLIEQKLNYPLIKLLEKLHKERYHLYIASNIWGQLFMATKEKFPFLITLFQGYFIVSKEHHYVEKPHPRYYQDLKQYIYTQEGKVVQIVFIDDHLKNTKAAEKEGITAIHFISDTQLLHDLKKMDVHVP